MTGLSRPLYYPFYHSSFPCEREKLVAIIPIIEHILANLKLLQFHLPVLQTCHHLAIHDSMYFSKCQCGFEKISIVADHVP